ncbi:MATE family efflux transporter [Blautia wexlerae]|uniref:MATE family efflux transporter n=1 Tax=Blautia wexlerae TaxID=418240 RepID=A0ABX2GRI1_9FIRM|nr:MATE family efflux transporter [Blautia wexlerae]NSF74291.1 MATE family efflux transporter [Blautia wexlerae]
MEGNLTKGPILKTLTKLAVPIMASAFLGTLYNITDMAWIGLLGSRAVAGVGVGGMFTWLSQGLAAMARMGGQVQVAQCIGRGERERAHGFAQAAVQLSAFMGIAYAVLSLLFTRQMVGFFQLADAEAHTAAMSYTRIACGLIVFSFLTLTLTGIYTAQGDSKTPFLANLVGLAMNMILDPVLILGPGIFPRLGVAGAAIATVTAQAIVMSIMILGIMVQKKENVLKGIKLFAKLPREYVGGICKIGIPTAIQGMAYCAISMVLTRMVSGYGAEAIATQRVGGQIESISWNTADGFGAALNAFIAQNYGAGKNDRVRKGYKASLWTVGIWGVLISAIFICVPGPIAKIFFHEPKAIATAVGYLTIIGFSEAFMCVELTTVGALSGLGRTRLCSIISIIFTSARIPLAILLGGIMGLNGIWWALSSTSIVKGIIFACTFLWITRKRK